MIINESHPLFFILELFRDKDATLWFSKYNYIPDSISDDREIFSINSKEASVEFFKNKIGSLNESQELAFHSNFKYKGRNYHLPLVDFSTEEWNAGEVIDRFIRFVGKDVVLNMRVYNSGRSFHGYSNLFLSPKEWIKYMGGLLLVNQKEKDDIVDARWVGHRLIGGYSSLRLSNNTKYYKSIPHQIHFP